MFTEKSIKNVYIFTLFFLGGGTSKRKFVAYRIFRSPLAMSAKRASSLRSSVADPGCLSLDPGSDFLPPRIPDPNCLHPGSRILIKELKYFNPKKKQKKWFLSSKKYDPGCSSRIPDPGPGCWLSPILDPGSRGQKGTQSRIPDPGSGSATLLRRIGLTYINLVVCIKTYSRIFCPFQSLDFFQATRGFSRQFALLRILFQFFRLVFTH